jgi:Protein of unknown function (DUF3300)
MCRVVVSLLVFCLGSIPAVSANPSVAAAYAQDQDQGPAPSQEQNPDYQPFSPEQLDNLLSPIALYPDPLLAQVLVAATFPDQVEEAARWVRGNGQSGIDDQYWDVSVKAVAHYPTVVQMMADKIDWTTSVGQAYVNQSTDVTRAVQRLRHMARRAGNLVTTPQWEVIENGEYIAIDPIQPRYIYVPVYDPAICYYRRPYWGPAIAFGVGVPIGAWLNLDFRWGYGGGWGGVFYTGWRPWGGWNGGWVDRCRPYVRESNVYINNRYTNVTVNRTVINRQVNVTNINHYNYIHNNVTYNNVTYNNVTYNNVQVNNTRVNNYNGRYAGNRGNIQVNNNVRVNNNVQNSVNSNVRNNRVNNTVQNNVQGNQVNNKVLNRNIDVNNSRVNDFRGHQTFNRNDRPPGGQLQTQQAVQNHPQFGVQNQVHTFGRSEGNFNANVSSQRGQTSRTQMTQPVHTYTPAPRGGGGGGGGGHPGGGKHP